MAEPPDNLAPTRRFSARAGHYARYRPSYPASLIDFLATDLRLVGGSVVADIGSGTGILSRLLLERSLTVIAVEPNREMREAAEKTLGLLPNFRNFHSVNGTAEATTLDDAGVDAVVAAQAFHWFDHEKAIREFRRIARRGASLALIWNVRRNASPFMAEYERIVRQFGPEVEFQFEKLRELFGPALRQRRFDNAQELDWEGLRGRLLSASYMPMEGSAGFAPMMVALRETFDRHQKAGRVRLDYDTRVYLAPLGVEAL